MIRHAAFLRGVNLGQRTTKSADLVAAFAGMGFAGAKTLIASGNVLFEADPAPDLAERIEAGLAAHFGFDIGVVLRTDAELRAMVAADPFRHVPPDADAKLYVALLREPVGRAVGAPFGVPGDFDVISATERELFAIAWHMPNGRYGEGLDTLGKRLPKGTLVTTRNWNTILKAAK
ncbi:MAG TPA: DUF1697 domain-containing protein [Devosia sp.]|nr:DUF1697 domain-containing protein [Devosia sp.]